MIYATKERAQEIASMLNAERGQPPAKAVLTPDGWTVIATYRNNWAAYGKVAE